MTANIALNIRSNGFFQMVATAIMLIVAFHCEPSMGQSTAKANIAGQQFALWENGAPDSIDRKDEAEQAKDYWVKNVHDPSVTVFQPPAGSANGTAVVIFPGGGHRMLVYKAEGYEPAQYFVDHGVTAFVVKYRLAREENSPYDLNIHPQRDGARAMRWVRHHAKDYGVDPDRIGIVGFSAGGEVASEVIYDDCAGNESAEDPIDRVSAQAQFQVLIYPGPLGIPEVIPTTAPPTFMVVANDDGASKVVLDLASKYRAAKVPIELHLYAKGGHGFNMGNRSKLKSISTWKDRLTDWMMDNEIIPAR